MEFRKSIINDNGLTRKGDHIAYSVKKNEKFDQEIKNGGCLKTMNFKKFSNYKSGFAALFKKNCYGIPKSVINCNELTRGYAHLVYSVKKLKILIVKSIMVAVCKLSIFNFFLYLDCSILIASDLETCTALMAESIKIMLFMLSNNSFFIHWNLIITLILGSIVK